MDLSAEGDQGSSNLDDAAAEVVTEIVPLTTRIEI